MEPATERKELKKTAKLVSYTNRKGQAYFLHQGFTKTGKPKYFASQKRECAISKLPDGYVIVENINGIVTVQRPKPVLIPDEDIKLLREKVAEYRHLEHYRVEVKDNAILVYEPIGMDAVKSIDKLTSPSMLESMKTMLGSHWKDALAETAKKMGMSVAELKRMDSLAATQQRKKTTDYLMRNMQYDTVIRFILDPLLGAYRVERRCYRGERDWASLGFGSLDKMAIKYIKHIGRESFFGLM